jgi:hypothetical protein
MFIRRIADKLGNKLNQGSLALYDLSDNLDNRMGRKIPYYRGFQEKYGFGTISRASLSGLSLLIWTRIPLFPYYGLNIQFFDKMTNGNYTLSTALNGIVNYLSIAFPNKSLW